MNQHEFYYKFIRPLIPNWYYTLRNMYYRLTRGFADCETFEFLVHCAAYSLPRLKHLRDNLHGCPSDLCPVINEENPWEVDTDIGMKAWEDILDKIIFAMEEIAYQTAENELLKKYPFEFVKNSEKIGNNLNKGWFVPTNEDNWNAYYEGMRLIEKRKEEGCILFGKYFLSLWD